jgi:CRISPR-associated protein Cas2
MRIFVMFDLPVLTAEERKKYRLFRKYLVKNGFIMLQESVYCKMVPNSAAGDAVSAGLRKNKPPEGSVQVLKVTEKQFQKMDYMVGSLSTSILNDDERLVVL